MPEVYEQRLLLYADILGWSAEIGRNDGAKLLAVAERIHKDAEWHSEAARVEFQGQVDKVIQTDIGPMKMGPINPMYLATQFGAFSDHFVFSVPASFGPRIFNMASKMIIDVLRAGFLVRGAIVLGALHHKDNIVFGPALLEAVAIEENEAFYPRILLGPGVLDHCKSLPYDDRTTTVVQDQTGRVVVNPFAVEMIASDEIIASFVELNFAFDEIKPLMERQIRELEAKRAHCSAVCFQDIRGLRCQRSRKRDLGSSLCDRIDVRALRGALRLAGALRRQAEEREEGKLVVSADFLEAVTAAAELTAGPRTIPWPTRERRGGLVHFENYAEWQKFLLAFDLPPGVPGVVKDAFDRARKVYLLSWVDFDLAVVGEVAALTALELAVRNRYLPIEVARRQTKLARRLGAKIAWRRCARMTRPRRCPSPFY
jgi:hypothetical protein